MTQQQRAKMAGHRSRVGGLWEQIGLLQFNYLVDQGLRPEHRFVDIGCGCMRGGVHFVRYLDTGHYYGIDKSNEMLGSGTVELLDANLLGKKANLYHNDVFNLRHFRVQFDYALAQSVFTHLPPDDIRLCLTNLRGVMKPEGIFFATFFEGAHRLRGRSYFYPFATFEELAAKTGWQVEYIGEWNHPRDQKMMRFTPR